MGPQGVDFEQALLRSLLACSEGLPPPRRLYVAFSGGRDSTVLLHALAAMRARLPCPLAAVHVDHRLQAASAAWARHCAQQASALDVPCISLMLDDAPGPGESLEAWARDGRYRAFARLLTSGDLLLTAHHQDDQAESFLLAALRGSGPAGLRGIAARRQLGAGWLLRPMLDVPVAAVDAFAREHRLSWIEDPMNRDVARARGFLRTEILPRLREQWPAAAAVLARNARWQGDTQTVLEACARQHLQAMARPDGALPVADLEHLPLPLRSVVLRLWIGERGYPLPDSRRLDEILRIAMSAAPDRVPEVFWAGVCLRRWREALHLAPQVHTGHFEMPWDPLQPLRLPGGCLSAAPVTGAGLRCTLLGRGLRVRSRRGGERCRLPGRLHHTPVKDVLQASGVPPWQRTALPFIYAGEALVAVGDLFVCAEAVAGPGEAGWQLKWQEGSAMGIVGGALQESQRSVHD